MNTENNKLIAEFMGKQLPYKSDNGNWKFNVKGAGLITSTNVEDLNRFLGFDYDINWGMLMPVVEKIENLEYIDRMGRFNVTSVNFEENYTGSIFDLGKEIIQEEGEDKITATYNVVVKFIKWYNQQK